MKAIFNPFLLLLAALISSTQAQTLINIDFGVGSASAKTGFAATGQATNDLWNLYRHYDPKFVPGAALVSDGELKELKHSDGTPTKVSIAVQNAPGVWGNSTGDPMYDSYIFSQNGSNITVTIQNLEAGRYHFYMYGHADPDVTGEQNSSFSLNSGTNQVGPLTTLGSAGWKAGTPWQERYQYVVFRDVQVTPDKPVVIEVAAGPNGVPVLNGMQIISRGTSPPRLATAEVRPAAATLTNLILREIAYEGTVSDTEARFQVSINAQSMTTNEISASLFEGDIAVITEDLPEGLRIVSSPKAYRLVATAPGNYTIKLTVVAKITRKEPWNEIAFAGPAAAIASVKARASSAGLEMQLLSGTATTISARGSSTVEGFLGPDRTLALRWQSKTTEIARKSLVTVDTAAQAQITPTVIKYSTAMRFEVLQAALPELRIELPTNHTLTKITGEQIRDWNVRTEAGRQTLAIEFIKPVEKNYQLSLLTEQALSGSATSATLIPPQPLNIERESGSFTILADDMQAEIATATGLRQVNVATNAIAAYRFYDRPVSLLVRLKRIEPLVKVADRVTSRLEEARLLITHDLNLKVEKAGVYALNLTPQPGFIVADVRGEGIDDWKVTDGQLRINFATRLLGDRKITVQLEQALRSFTNQFTLLPLRVAGATNETATVGAAASPGITLKTAGDLVGLREVPVASLGSYSDELLAFKADQGAWQLTLSTERLPARIVAEVFNLLTVGEGLIGGSATIRYGLINQGVQSFRVQLPAHWKNVEFTGPNIRRKEITSPTNDPNGVTWTVSLQDKAWGGYTLVITYDYQFDPKGANLNLAGAHALDVERETGSIAVTTAGNLKLEPQPVAEPLRVIDPTELAETDRALITRPVLLAYRYAGSAYALNLAVTRHGEVSVLDAVADRTQLTSVLTEEGQMLTQASFMVKNNDKQFQKFRLPPKATLWGCYVNNQPVKGELDGDWLAVSLPRGADRDKAFAVDIVYAQTFPSLKSRALPKTLELGAPKTDVPNTYAEWQLYVPPTQRLSSFAGTMSVLRGTTYGLQDAWQKFLAAYRMLWRDSGPLLFFVFAGGVLLLGLIAGALKRGWRGIAGVGLIAGIVLIIAGIMAPASRVQKLSDSVSYSDSPGYLAAADPTPREEPARGAALNETMYNPVEAISGVPAPTTPPPATQPADAPGKAGETDFGIANGAKRLPQSAAASSRARGETRVADLADVQTRGGDGIQRGRDPTNQQGGGGFGGGVMTVTAAGYVNLAGKPTTAAGIRSIRIDIPRSGKLFSFTKVLNVSDEPLSVKMSVMKEKWFVFWRALLQLGCFVVGLVIIAVQWFRATRSSLWMTAGLALVLGAIVSVLITYRVLHLAFIAAVPILFFAIAAALIWKYWPKQTAIVTPGPEPEQAGPSNVPPAVAAFLLLASMFFSSNAAAAQSARSPALPPTNAFSLVSADYRGTITDSVGQFTAQIQVATFATNQIVPLFGPDIALESFSSSLEGANLLRDGNMLSVRLPSAGSASLQVKFFVKLGGEVSKRQLIFGVPPALSSKLALTIQEAEADVDFPTAVSFRRASTNQQTQVTAVLGAGDRVEMYWTPRVKRITEMTASIFVQNTSLLTVGAGVVNTRSTLDYQISQGELRQVKVRIPTGQRLLRLEGDLIRTWEINEETDGQMLTVDLVKGVSPAYKLTIETETVLPKLPATVRMSVPAAQDVIRESGLLGIRGGDELGISVESAAELQRVDPAELARLASLKAEGITSAYRYLNPNFQLQVRVEPVVSQIEALARNALRIGFEQVTLHAQLDYTVKKAGVFSLRAAIPKGFRVESVHGEKISQWSEREEQGLQILDVSFQQRILGSYKLSIELSQLLKELPPSFSAPGVHPIGVDKLTGFLAVTAEGGIQLKSSAFTNLTEIPPAQAMLPENWKAATSGLLTYKFILPDGKWQNAPWTLTVSAETVDSWVRAEVVNIISVSDTLISGRAQVRYEIQNAPLKQLAIRVPAAYTNVEISGTNIRRKDRATNEWRIELQNKSRGIYDLTLTWEQPGTLKTNTVLEFSGVEPLNVERDTGALVIMAKPPLQVAEQAATEQLVKIDARELPDWAGVKQTSSASDRAEVPVLVYRYLRPGYKLLVQATRFQEAAVLQALVESARLTTVVADDGQMMTEISLSVRNNGLQHLELQLPPKTRVWSAFVAGNPIRPAERGGNLLLPIERSGADEAPVVIELTYVGTDKFPKGKGRVALISPKMDVPLKNVRWDLYLPPDYDYSEFEGTMTHEKQTAPVVRVFSGKDYEEQEFSKKTARQSWVRSSVSNVKQRLSEGKFKEANDELAQATRLNSNSEVDGDTVKELEVLKKEIDKVQGGNLIQAQRAYTFDNNARFGSQAQQMNAPGQQPMGVYDSDAAEQQWKVLQRAQEITVRKIQPLRVNLPTRGAHHAFTQVLQTEIGKPMTIQFEAENTKSVSWFKRIIYIVGAFCMLWMFVAVVLNRQSLHPQTAQAG